MGGVEFAELGLCEVAAFQYWSLVLVEQRPIFQRRSRRFHVMVACLMRSLTSACGRALSVSCTARYLACLTCFSFSLLENLGCACRGVVDAHEFAFAVVEFEAVAVGLGFDLLQGAL